MLTQIYVEIERARLTRKLARIKEEEGQIKEAAETLQEVAVVGHAFSIQGVLVLVILLLSILLLTQSNAWSSIIVRILL